MAVKFVAEISSNHNGDLERCKAFIRSAREVGCDAVKFQLFKIDQLFAPEVLAKRADLRARREWEFPVEFLKPLADFTHDLGLEFGCTPFYLEAVEELRPYVDFFKVASYELLWDALLKACAETEKPLIISTGMATMDEILNAISAIAATGACKDLTVLQCTSAYPTPLREANLAAIETMREAFGDVGAGLDLKFGLSDHTVSKAVVLSSVLRHDARFVEFHYDLDGEGYEFGAGHCWLPEQIRDLIAVVRDAEHAEGNGVKVPAASELPDRNWRADPADGLRPLLHMRRSHQSDSV